MHLHSKQTAEEGCFDAENGKKCHDFPSLFYLCICPVVFIPNRTQSWNKLVSLNFQTSFSEVNNVLDYLRGLVISAIGFHNEYSNKNINE